jgi:hypothetical protein
MSCVSSTRNSSGDPEKGVFCGTAQRERRTCWPVFAVEATCDVKRRPEAETGLRRPTTPAQHDWAPPVPKSAGWSYGV